MKPLFIILSFLFLSLNIWGQNSEKEPTWLNGYHKDLSNSYIDVFSAVDESEDKARAKAIQNIVEERSRATGRRFNIKENNGNITLSSQDELTVKCRIVSEYHQRLSNLSVKVYLLVQTARHTDYAYEPVSVSCSYPITARILVPGWSQIYKGSTSKGLCMLGGCVTCGIGALFCENQRSDYKNKMKEQPQFAQSYNTKANNFETARNICLGATAAFYVWNIVDAIAAKGVSRIVVKPSDGNYLSVCPVATMTSVGVSMAYNF